MAAGCEFWAWHCVRTLKASVRAWGAACGVTALLVASQGPVRADVIVSVGNDVSPILTVSTATNVYRPLASSFTIGPTIVLLESVVLPLGADLVPVNGGPVFRDATIAIYDDSSGLPGSAVTGTSVTLNYDINSAMSDRTFSLATPVALSAGTTYWLVLDQTSEAFENLSTLRTVLNSADTNVGGSYATPNAGIYYENPWVQAPEEEQYWVNASLIYQLNGTAVPEASSLIFLGACSLGALGVAAWRRRTA